MEVKRQKIQKTNEVNLLDFEKKLTKELKQKQSSDSRKKKINGARFQATLLSEDEHEMDIWSIVPMPCKQPRFSGQTTIKGLLYYALDFSNYVLIFEDCLKSSPLMNYMEEAVNVPRVGGKSGFGMKPRRELCYTPDGTSYRYSGVSHSTTKYPAHVTEVMKIFEPMVNDRLKEFFSIDNPYTVPSSAVDIIYDSTFPRGGSISKHKDDEKDWGMVMVFSLGQERYLRIRSDETGKYYNFSMPHNSLVVMYGETFQKKYTHQVDKLLETDKVGTRLSLNIRYQKN